MFTPPPDTPFSHIFINDFLMTLFFTPPPRTPFDGVDLSMLYGNFPSFQLRPCHRLRTVCVMVFSNMKTRKCVVKSLYSLHVTEL
jgi:hypothetical protein